MTDKIAPALTPEQWEQSATASFVSTLSSAALIALANAALPDGDPRKITWAMVDALLCVVQQDTDAQRWGPFDGEIEGAAGCQRLADALASYLPPRETL